MLSAHGLMTSTIFFQTSDLNRDHMYGVWISSMIKSVIKNHFFTQRAPEFSSKKINFYIIFSFTRQKDMK